jgi:cytochrome c5
MRANVPLLAITSSALMAAAVAATVVAAGDSQKPTASGGKANADPTLSAVVRPAETAEIGALPDDPAKRLVSERCLMCHGAGLITQQHKDAAAWGRAVTQMRTWGSPIQDEEQATIVAYLSKHFGPAQP